MNRVPFDPKRESEPIGETLQFKIGRHVKIPAYFTPITQRENYLMMLRHEIPFWMPIDYDAFTFIPRIIPDNVARGMVYDAEPVPPEESGGPDLFGIEWVYVPEVGGSMVKPGKPRLTDINDWQKEIAFPNLDELDWEGSASKNLPLIDKNKIKEIWIMNGLFERLISFMDFEGAALALIEEDSKDAVHALFDRLCVFYDDLIERFHRYYGAEIVLFHDDWGSQRAPFFSFETCREMLLPYLKRVVDSCHKRGMYFNFHCCGKSEELVPLMVEAGVDIWFPQPMNDIPGLAKKYGGVMCFGDTPPILPPDSPDEVVEKTAREFLQMYEGCTNMVCLGSMYARTNPAFARLLKEIYRLTREKYNEMSLFLKGEKGAESRN